jgi:DNA-directed RNA polymerase specialized sigma24 family protein
MEHAQSNDDDASVRQGNRKLGVRFPDTSWTLLGAACGEGDGAARARTEFVERYFRPVYAYLGAIVRDPEKAEDLTQGFFEVAILSGRLLARADPAKGGFRPYLKQALRNYVIDARRKGARSPVPGLRPDTESGGWDLIIADEAHAADAAFHDAWVRSLLEEALDRVCKICETKGQREHFELFAGRYLSDVADLPGWRALGARYALDEKTARSRADTVSRHFRAALREILRRDVGSDEDVDAEVAALLSLT